MATGDGRLKNIADFSSMQDASHNELFAFRLKKKLCIFLNNAVTEAGDFMNLTTLRLCLGERKKNVLLSFSQS